MRRNISLGSALFFAIGSVCIPLAPVRAQPPATQTKLFSPLDAIDYDATRSGPLLLVYGDFRRVRIHPFEGRPGLAEWADMYERQVVTVGNLTVLAPKTMQIIVEHPGVPDPYANLKPEERLKLLLSLFSEAQWQQAGSATGIGLEDLNDNQRPLFLGLLPEKIVLQRNKLVAGDEQNSTRYEPQCDPQQEDPATTHLRLNSQVSFRFSKAGSDDYGFMSDVSPEPGDEITTLLEGREARGDTRDDPDTVYAFGVPILERVPNKLKFGQLNFAAPQLRILIPLDSDLKTLGDLLGRVAHTTGLDLVADRRVAALPLMWRIAPGQKARAGDILAALCWSVTGAFRCVGASTFLLTDDIQGIGTRFARLEEWAEPPSGERQKALDALNAKTAKNNPLSHIGFAPGDPNALPPSLLKRVNDFYLNGGKEPEFAPSDLPASLQHQIDNLAQVWADLGTTIRTDRVQVYTAMVAQFVFPDGTAVEAPVSDRLGRQYLQYASALSKPVVPKTSAPLPAPKPMPASLRKRVLVAQLPTEDKALVDLLTLAKSKGFTEVWLQVMLNDGEAATHLRTALKAGRKVGISVGCAVSLLHAGGLHAAEDINIFGETGESFFKRLKAKYPDESEGYQRYAGWSVLDPAQIARILTPLAEVQGLSALTFKATAAPGWAGNMPGGDGIYPNGHLGYTVETRLLCIRSEGFDPIDAYPYLYLLNLDPSLSFFPSGYAEGVWKALNDFRFRENTRQLAQIHATIRQIAPTLPLYLDDRASPYCSPYVSWYGRWESADRVPKNPVYAVESEARAVAVSMSSEPIRIRYGRNIKPEDLARAFGDTAQDAAKNWRGVAFDLSRFAPTDALHMLGGLPTTP